jgi:hypothetical protein
MSSLTLDLPDWLPISIGKQVVDILQHLRSSASEEKIAECFPVVRRLATDKRMKPVWAQLTKRKRENYRPTNSYLHAAAVSPEVATAIGIDSQDSHQVQTEMMAGLFFLTFRLATSPLVLVRRKGFRPRFLMRYEDADRFENIKMELPPEFDIQSTDPMMDARYREGIQLSCLGLWHIILCTREVALIVNRSTIRDARARCVGMGVASVNKEFFGDHLYGIASTITSVALDDNIKLSQVRQWCGEVEPIS